MGRIVIDKEKCKGCFLCVDVCPKNLIKPEETYNEKGNYTVYFDDLKHECLGCALCAKRCPDMAIVEVYK